MAKDPEKEMPPNVKQANDLIVEAHEERIQRLEQVTQDTATKVATMEAKIESGFQYLGEKIESCLVPVTDRLSSHMDADEKTNREMAEAIKGLGAGEVRLTKLEEQAQKRRDWYSTMKKGSWALILVVAGAAAKALFDHLK